MEIFSKISRSQKIANSTRGNLWNSADDTMADLLWKALLTMNLSPQQYITDSMKTVETAKYRKNNPTDREVNCNWKNTPTIPIS